MFNCKTTFSCDLCGRSHSTESNRMADCASKDFFRIMLRKAGWKTIYGCYDVCGRCVEHYGMKEVRKMLKDVGGRNE